MMISNGVGFSALWGNRNVTSGPVTKGDKVIAVYKVGEINELQMGSLEAVKKADEERHDEN